MNRPLDRDVWQQHVVVGIELAFMRSFNEALDLVAHAAFKGFDAGRVFSLLALSPNLGAWPRINEPTSDDEKQIAYLAESAFDLSTRTIRRTLSRTD